MSDYGDYRAWLESVGLSLLNDEPATYLAWTSPTIPTYARVRARRGNLHDEGQV
jgi:hypothetical protein